jgi:hypothetical protein
MAPNIIAKTRRELLCDGGVRKQIELKAYTLYLDRGKTDGQHDQDWLRAEAEILAPLMEEAIRNATTGKKSILKKTAKQA